VKLYNRTHESTPLLEQYGMSSHSLAVGDELVKPGQAVEVTDEGMSSSYIKHLLAIGAFSTEAPASTMKLQVKSSAKPEAKASVAEKS